MAVTPDTLIDVPTLRTTLGIPDSTEDQLLSLVSQQVSAAIAEYFGREFLLASNPANPTSRIYRGKGTPELLVTDRPVQCPTFTANTVAGSAAVTNLSGTSYLFAGQPVAGPALPSPTTTAQTTLVSFDAAALTAVLSQPAALTATATPLTFAPAVYEDTGAVYGQAFGAFAADTQLVFGLDYGLEVDRADGSCRKGVLYRVNGVWRGEYRRDAGMLSTYSVPSSGTVKVVSFGGWPVAPAQLVMAASRACAKARKSALYGQLLSSESYRGYSYSTLPLKGVIQLGLLDGDVSALLAPLRGAPSQGD